MGATCDRNSLNPLVVPELVGFIVGYVSDPPDLLNCACVNSVWSFLALEKLYKGSINDMRYRTPDIGSLNCLLVGSRERFARNMSFVEHLVISTDTPAPDETARCDNRFACVERFRPLRHRNDAELLLRPKGKGPSSLAIPFEIIEQDLSPVSDLIIHPRLKFLTIDHVYCELLMSHSGPSQGPSVATVSPPEIFLFSLCDLTPPGRALQPRSTFNTSIRQPSEDRRALRVARKLRSGVVQYTGKVAA